MEEEETQSHASPVSEPHSPPPSGRITVTVAATPPPPTTTTAVPPPPNQSSLTLALPIQHPFRTTVGGGASGGGGGGRDDCWSEGATSVLIDAWGERYVELSRGNLKQKHWKEVADIVSSREDYTKPPKTDIQCKNRIDTVKKKYKIEKAKVSTGGGPSRWPFFDRLDRLIGNTNSSASASAAVGSTAGKAVPVGIPMGVRPLPLPSLPHYSSHHHLQTPLHLQPPPPQQQQFRHNNFSPSQLFHKFNPNPSKGLGRGRPMPASVESESDAEEGWSPDSGDSFPPDTLFERRKRAKVEVNNSEIGGEGGREKAAKAGVWGNSVRELTRAILKFGEAYEEAESTKLQQIVEMEKQRMKFAKDLELQRMKFLMKTQLKLSQLNSDGNNNSDSRCGGGSSGRRSGGGATGENNHLVHHENHVNHHTISDSSN